jgi:FtsZ-binding cell division protein ZapB
MKLPVTISLTVLPQEQGGFVAKASSYDLDAIAYGETKKEAIAAALESFAKTLRNYKSSVEEIERENQRLYRENQELQSQLKALGGEKTQQSGGDRNDHDSIGSRELDG